MAQKTTVKQDNIGLYVVAGGWIARPFYGTIFNVGDNVLTHHFGGNTNAGVTTPGKSATHNFRNKGIQEIWSTTGVMASEYSKLSAKEIMDKTQYYINAAKALFPVYNLFNSDFVK